MVPTSARSSSVSTGRLMAPGAWSSTNSAGLRTSITAGNAARLLVSAALRISRPDRGLAFGLGVTPRYRIEPMTAIAPEAIPHAVPRLTSLAHGGGCGCKLAPAVLQSILKGMPATAAFANLMVGTDTADDA